MFFVRPGKMNVADALSRLNSLDQVGHGEEYEFGRTIVESRVPVAKEQHLIFQ